ncbi:MAG TPA: lipoate--protein ligase family protein [Acidimicrobiia bacterium]
MRRIRLLTDHFPMPPGLDTGISHALVLEVGAGRQPETLRLHDTTDIVAFGRHDTITPGYPAAVAAAIEHGFTPIERLAGGRAAVFHTGTLAFAWAIPENEPRAGVSDRFQLIAEILRDALASLEVPAGIGELPGEYCPGRYSIHGGGRIKLIGVGQRLVRGAAHVGGVICVRDGDRIRRVLEPVYRALDLDWDPATAGAIDDLVPSITVDAVRHAVTASFASRFDIQPAALPQDLVDQGQNFADSHVPPA